MPLLHIIKPDVWGNEEAGWDINDLTIIGTMHLPDNEFIHDGYIVEQLAEQGFISTAAHCAPEHELAPNGVYIDDSGGEEMLVCTCFDSYPLVLLRVVE